MKQSPELRLISTVLATFVFDIRKHYRFWLYSKIVGDSGQGQMNNLEGIYGHVKSPWCQYLCDLIDLDHEKFIKSLQRSFPVPNITTPEVAKGLLESLKSKSYGQSDWCRQ